MLLRPRCLFFHPMFIGDFCFEVMATVQQQIGCALNPSDKSQKPMSMDHIRDKLSKITYQHIAKIRTVGSFIFLSRDNDENLFICELMIFRLDIGTYLQLEHFY